MKEPKYPFNDPNDEDSAKWATVSTRMVAPPSKRVPEGMRFSVMDNVPGSSYVSYAFLYRAQAGNRAPIDRLCESLSKALGHFYPLAGRLVKDAAEDEPRLLCSDDGVPVLHRRYDGAVSDLIDLERFRPIEQLAGVGGFDLQSDVFPPSGLPVLVIQVTDFNCGTKCVSVTCCHLVVDAFSCAHFLKSWAEISRNEPISLKPVFDRGHLAPRETSQVLNGAPVRFLNDKAKVLKPIEAIRPEEGLGCLTLRLSRRKIEDLKREASSNSTTTNSALSSADCASAHLWRTVTRLRNHEPHELTRFMSYVNLRSRMKNLPAGYFGNALALVVCVERVGKLLSEPLNYAASMIHESVQAMDDNLARDWVDWMSLFDPKAALFCSAGDEPFMPGDPAFSTHTVVATWQNRFPFFEFDVGFGSPYAMLKNAFRMGYGLTGFAVLPTVSAEEEAVMLYFENRVIGAIKEVF